MATMTPDEMKTWLSDKLGREITISQVSLKGDLGYMVDYINHTAPATKLVAQTPVGAVEALFIYLSVQELAPKDQP